MGELTYAPMPSPHQYNPLENVVKAFQSLFTTREGQQVKQVNFPFPEYGELLYSERRLVTYQVEEYLKTIRDLMMAHQVIGYEMVYNRLCPLIPSTLLNPLMAQMEKCKNLSSRLINGDESYEDILKRYMNCASDLNSFKSALVAPLIFDNLQTAGKVFDIIIKVINKFGSKSYNTVDSDIIPIKPIVLALLWALLLMRLTTKFTNSCADFEMERIARLSLSLVLSLFTGFTGYAHSGGYTGMPPITSWIKLFYVVRTEFEKEHPYYYSLVPSVLKFNECYDFNRLTKYQQKDAGQGMNMVYTFRVGDSLLRNLEGHTLVSEDVIKQTMRSIWPLPSEYEAKRMYEIYADNKIYYL